MAEGTNIVSYDVIGSGEGHTDQPPDLQPETLPRFISPDPKLLGVLRHTPWNYLALWGLRPCNTVWCWSTKTRPPPNILGKLWRIIPNCQHLGGGGLKMVPLAIAHRSPRKASDRFYLPSESTIGIMLQWAVWWGYVTSLFPTSTITAASLMILGENRDQRPILIII